MNLKRILIDQDGVLADFEAGFHAAWTAQNPGMAAVPLQDRRTFYVRDDYPSEFREAVENIYTAPGFYRGLAPIPGAMAAMHELKSLGHDVRICTSPLRQYRHCVGEKFEWVDAHLGPAFVDRLIVTKDKTLVHGNLLVDDKPEVCGVRAPDWRQVIFDQPYNRGVSGARMDWSIWRQILLA